MRASNWSGTGWVYKVDGSGHAWILTNEHVVEEDATVSIYPANGGEPFTGDVIGVDELRDLAVVRICCTSGLRALELATADEVVQGAQVVAFGYPYSAGVLSDLSVSDGIISRIGYYDRRDSNTVQTTAESNPGNSGGPLVNTFGKVVGTMWGSVDRSPSGRPIDGIAFAVAPSTIRARLSALEAGVGRVPTQTPTVTPTPTPIPPPAIPPTPVPDNWGLVLVAVGDADQRHLDANERKVVADWLGVSVADLPDVEADYRLTSRRDDQNKEIIVTSSGDLTIEFAEVTNSYSGYKPWLMTSPFKLYGRVCPYTEDCDKAVFQELSGYVVLDEDSGTADRTPWMRLTVSIPAGYSIRIEVMAYYTSSATAATPTPTATSTTTPTPTPSRSGQELVIVAVGDSDQRVPDSAKRQVLAQRLRIDGSQVPEVAQGYRLVSSSDQGDEVVLSNSGLYALQFAGIQGAFNGYSPIDVDESVWLFGRVCDDGSNCGASEFQDLSDYVTLDEHPVSGSASVSPVLTISGSIPAAKSIRIEVVAYYTSGQ